MAARFLAWSDLRRRWRTWLVLALLIGLAGTAVLGSAAAARRTHSAYPRLVERTNMFDVLVNPDDGEMEFGPVEALPQVAQAAHMSGVLVVPTLPDGTPDMAASDELVFFAAHDDRGMRTINRPTITAGRLPDPSRVDEVFVEKTLAAQQRWHVGTSLEVMAFGPDAFDALEAGEEPPKGETATVRVVGIGTSPQYVPVAAADRLPAAYLTPAFDQRFRPATMFEGSLVELRPGADAAGFIAAAQRADGEPKVYYQTQSDLRGKAARAVQPYWGALAAFAVIAALASLLIIGQAIGRQLAFGGGEVDVTRALGMSQRELFAAALLRVVVVACAGAVVAVIGAAVSSLFTPIGPARLAEPDPGFAPDLIVLLLGGVAIVALLLAVTALPAWQAALGHIAAEGRRSAVAGALAGAGFSAPAAAGVRMALEPGGGRSAVPVRATMTSAAIAVASLTAALTFAVSLDRLLGTPRLYGGDFDAVVVAASEDIADSTEKLEQVVASLANDPKVAEHAVGSHVQLTIAGSMPVAAIALEADARPVFPTIVEGRAPRRDDEIVLGAASRERAGIPLGGTVTASTGEQTRRFRVVGEAVFPRFSAYPGADKTGMGEGAALTLQGLNGLTGENIPEFALARFRPGLDADVERVALSERLEKIIPNQGPFERAIVSKPERPDDILGYEDVSATPLVLAGLLAIVAGATTAHALVSSVRRRRRDLALLKTIGFLRSQVRAAVAWQATTVAAVALAIGIPLGIAGGRWGWTWLAERMHAVPQPVTPWLALAVLLPGTVALANAVAAIPAGSAARTRPAAILRAE